MIVPVGARNVGAAAAAPAVASAVAMPAPAESAAAAAPALAPVVAVPAAESAAVVAASPPVGEYKWWWRVVEGHLSHSVPGSGTRYAAGWGRAQSGIVLQSGRCSCTGISGGGGHFGGWRARCLVGDAG